MALTEYLFSLAERRSIALSGSSSLRTPLYGPSDDTPTLILFSLQKAMNLRLSRVPLVWIVFPTRKVPFPNHLSSDPMADLKKDMGRVMGSPPCHMNHADSYSSETSLIRRSTVSSGMDAGTVSRCPLL